MIKNIQNYAAAKKLSLKDALQVFLQVIVLKNLGLKSARLIGGTALVVGHENPRFSEDIDLTGVSDPFLLKPYLEKSARELEGLLGAEVSLSHPKPNAVTWRLSCKVTEVLFAKLHVDSQGYSALTSSPIMIEYPGVAPFAFASVALEEIMADKLVALAFRKNLSGRDIFDLWYHWLKMQSFTDKSGAILEYVAQKLKMRKLKKEVFQKNISSKFEGAIPRRVQEEWSRYLPASLKNAEFYKSVFAAVKDFATHIKL